MEAGTKLPPGRALTSTARCSLGFCRWQVPLALVAMLPVAMPSGAAEIDAPSPPDDRPNIVIVLLDDLGYSDLGAYGGEIQTPHIDRLAARGLRFTRFYNSARCCPTRASLLTGLYPHQVGLVRNGASLTRDGATIAEALGSAGYQTAMTGKWHLSAAEPLRPPSRHLRWLNHQIDPDRPFAPLETYPINRGFDRYYGNIWGVVNYFDPYSLVEGETPVPSVPNDYYITDAITEKSVQYIREMADSDDPFFLYVAHCAPHWPLHARPEDIARYEQTYTGGWHQLRNDRYHRQVELGVIDRETHPLPELMGEGEDWAELDAPTRRWMSSQMAVHAAMVDRVDQGVGQIVETLKQTGRYDNTLILILADNGASPERYLNPGYDRPSETRDGQPIQYRGLFEPGSETTWPYIGSYWANAANTPFRYWKMESFEGGAHTPLVAHWPDGLKTAPGSFTDQLGHVIDIMPTCLELGHAEYPEEYQGHPILPAEGKSLAPILGGGQREEIPTLYFEHAGGKAIVDAEWKLVQPTDGPRWQLYHLASDHTETRDVAAEHPDKVDRLQQKWREWAARVGAPDGSL